MRFKRLVSLLVSCTIILSPVATYAKNDDVDQNVQNEIHSKIVKIDNLLKEIQLAGNNSKLSSSSNSVTRGKLNQQRFSDEVNAVHVEVENYFRSLDSSEYYKSPEFKKLIEKLDQLDLAVDKNYKENVSGKAAKTWRYGDILFYSIGSKNAIGERSFTGHTGVLSTTKYFVIEASKTKNNGAKVHHWNRTNLWKGASGIKQYKVTSKLGNNASTADRKKAVKYGLNQVGEPYSLKTSIFSDNKWYCSKLTMRQWYNAGYDLRGARGLTWSGFLLVIPNDIQIDANTRLYKDWGSKTPELT
ncbi:YiiX/YebB-like N1pC/P60 family cysteine hydrolase [Bacillus sp. REN10]|uniref:YiiX/YebB-like N1pC/P60 family cysteine hydrolase n=1 Tax=Bacillus sp. REN10 TaxID=2782541 RepID=UPI00193BBAB9|nr:YiiX/YebB-like N1pC/P60 family cysteine hydrolase [Bacillus sp. REN10]